MEKLTQLIARILNIDENSIHDASSPETISEWDSLNGILLVIELEKNFNVKFTMDEVMAVKNVSDIKAALKRYDVKAEVIG
ncbi:MAG: acyl carrier protein [Nanoarchaeota archaeon]|nr:acyl carrier protein [Nanoarchaeota archaeon]